MVWEVQVRVPRFGASVGCAFGTCILVGCAGNATVSNGFSFSGRPQLLIPAADREEVKTLAADAARKKGWSIVNSTDQIMVLQRPMPPGSPSGRAAGVADSTGPAIIEVTTAFAEERGGVNVGLSATLISQPPGESAPRRTDYTDTYRSTLDQSLESLRKQWVSRQPSTATASSSTETRRPAAKVSGSESPAASSRIEPPATPSAPQPQQTRPPQPDPVPSAAATATQASALTPETSGGSGSATPKTEVPPPQPATGVTATTPSKPDVSVTVGTNPAPPYAAPLPTPEPAAGPANNLVTLTPPSGTGVWAYYAEQYARLRGCNVNDIGAELVEVRAGAEIHRVSCVGGEVFQLMCQDGVCRALQ